MKTKFKAKLVSDQTWIYGDLISNVTRTNNQSHRIYKQGAQIRVFDDTIRELAFTENEVDFYEGDIVSIHQFLFDGSEYEKECIGVITKGKYGWMLSNILSKEIGSYMGCENGEGECYISSFYGLHEESFTLLGNDIDNADLLENA